MAHQRLWRAVEAIIRTFRGLVCRLSLYVFLKQYCLRIRFLPRSPTFNMIGLSLNNRLCNSVSQIVVGYSG